uniref:Uncharacterized protein n=1 Tax=Romanomermis culicivorax TaxID=13658 RepID=A0A915KUJ1_ROMCU
MESSCNVDYIPHFRADLTPDDEDTLFFKSFIIIVAANILLDDDDIEFWPHFSIFSTGKAATSPMADVRSKIRKCANVFSQLDGAVHQLENRKSHVNFGLKTDKVPTLNVLKQGIELNKILKTYRDNGLWCRILNIDDGFSGFVWRQLA